MVTFMHLNSTNKCSTTTKNKTK